MRQLHSYDLLDPKIKLEIGSEKSDVMKQNLIYTFEKDDLLFEVYEIQNPT